MNAEPFSVDLTLYRRGILVTRPRARAGSWVKPLAEAGADLLVVPAFELELPSPAEQQQILDRLRGSIREDSTKGRAHAKPWLAVTSPTSAEHLLAIAAHDESRTLLNAFEIAVVGERTEALLDASRLEIRLKPETASGAELARAILTVSDKPVVFHATSSKGRDDLKEIIEAAGGSVERLVVSYHRSVEIPSELIERELDRGAIDAVLFASPSAIKAYRTSLNESVLTRLQKLKCLVTGETTAQTARECGFVPQTLPGFDDESIVESVAELLRGAS